MRQTVTFGKKNAVSVPEGDARQKGLRPVPFVAMSIGASLVLAVSVVFLWTARQPPALGGMVQSGRTLDFVAQGIEACLPAAARPFWKGTTVPPVAAQLFAAHVEAISRNSGTTELDLYFDEVIGPILDSWDEADRTLFMGLLENGLVSQQTRSCVISNAKANPPD